MSERRSSSSWPRRTSTAARRRSEPPSTGGASRRTESEERRDYHLPPEELELVEELPRAEVLRILREQVARLEARDQVRGLTCPGSLELGAPHRFRFGCCRDALSSSSDDEPAA